MYRMLYRGFVSLMVPLSCSLVLHGNPIAPPFQFGGGLVCVGASSPTNFCDGSIADVNNIELSNSGTLSGMFGSPADGITTSMSASGTASYGVLKADASATIDINTADRGAEAEGEGTFRDIITANFAPFTGDLGFLSIQYELSGTNSSSGLANASTLVIIDAFGPTIADQGYSQVYSSPSVSGVFTVPPIEIVYGQPFDLFVILSAAVGASDTSGTGVGTGDSDFSDTFVLSGMTLTDANGNPVVGATFTSGSGTVYTQNGVVTPEPSSRWVVLAVLIGLIVLRRSRMTRRMSVSA
jgi:hypothetical protein